MLLDQLSLLTAIAFSSAALILTLLINWFGSRKDGFLLSWSAGLTFVVGGVIAYGMTVESYGEIISFASFALTQIGFGFIYAGALQFRDRPKPFVVVAIITATLIGAFGILFLVGLSGVATIIANLGLGVVLALAGYQYWQGRREAFAPMIANAVLYAVAATSFALCSVVLLLNGDWVLTSRPDNWAEELNALVMIIGLTGIGAISLTLNQSRWTRHHRDEARTDALTGLLNRRALFDSLAANKLEAGAAVIMFDLDHFKAINDRLGHAAGDAVIQHFALVLRQHLRDTDTAARLGGEEFCAILPPLPMEQARLVAERVRSAFEASGTPLTSELVASTVSVGLAMCGPTEAFSSVLNRADDALYKAKDLGRNRVTMAPAVRLIA